jgi:hypothetical protein
MIRGEKGERKSHPHGESGSEGCDYISAPMAKYTVSQNGGATVV